MIGPRELKTGREIILDVLPGTTRQIVERTGLSPTTARKLLRALIETRQVERSTMWRGSLSHTYVYFRVPL